MLTPDFQVAVDHYLPHHDKNGACPARVHAGAIKGGQLILRGMASRDQEVVAPQSNATFPWTPQRAKLHIAVFKVVAANDQEFYDVLQTDTGMETSIIYNRHSVDDVMPNGRGIVIPGLSAETDIFVLDNPTIVVPRIGGRSFDVCQVGLDERSLVTRQREVI